MPVDVHGNIYGERQAAQRLNILVIGGGIGGLAAAFCLAHAGHTVTIFEAARKLSEVGAGLQVSPNVSRLLNRWGMTDRIRECAVEPEALVFRRYNDGEVVGRSHWGETIMMEHGAPYYHMHRADLHHILLERLRQCPRVSVRLSSRIKSLDPNPDPNVTITLVSGEVFEGDMIVGADGVHSLTRQVVCGRADLAQSTGDVALRAVVSTDLMVGDPDLRALVEKPELTTWMGPKRHIMAYCIRGRKEYNIVMLCPDDRAEESYTAEGNVEKMKEDFSDFEPRVIKLLSHVRWILKWRLDERMPLKTWVHPEGRVVLLGDACHPMLPYRAQGAAMAIEDAAVLGNLLSRLAEPVAQHLPLLLHAYERLRYVRATNTQETSALNKYIFHLPDGPEQQARDASMRRAMLAESAHDDAVSQTIAAHGTPTNAANANQWADRKKNREQYSYDADAAVERWWHEEGEGELGLLLAELTPYSSTMTSSSSLVKSKKKSFWQRLIRKKDDKP
ncbi:FAD/NAD-binding domain-containing protein [Phellopilus nigrolimitatus]|nr:FAD/NAD-binding domain-containing protein [Phellopilus nigrolimitatus]